MSQDRKKSNHQKILTFLDELKQKPWLGNRRWWVDFLFHFTDIRNAVSILNSGLLLSRDEVERQRIDFADSASSKVIHQTSPEIMDEARLYFRPRTPTTYHMEGFKPLNKLYEEDAHCPVPIYFLFDMREIITLRDTRFSNGNLASRITSISISADQFTQLPFKDIYHDTSLHGYSDEEKRYIIRTKQAEVTYPKRISLNYLKYICCRSQAEYETLYNLLSPVVWNRWKSKVRIRNPHLLFYKRWLHIEEVRLKKESIDINFNLPDENERKYHGPFKIRVDIEDQWTKNSYYFQREYTNIIAELTNESLNLNLSGINISDYNVRVSIGNNDKLAYLGEYRDDNIPF